MDKLLVTLYEKRNDLEEQVIINELNIKNAIRNAGLTTAGGIAGMIAPHVADYYAKPAVDFTKTSQVQTQVDQTTLQAQTQVDSDDKSVHAQELSSPPEADQPESDELSRLFPKEYDTIVEAAKRNTCKGDDFLILLAIRKAENGRAGREFGILHPRAIDTNLDTQAGWAAATIVKNRARWIKQGKPGRFIKFLGSKYCPVGAENDPDGLNKHWVGNVTKFYNDFKGLK